MKQNSVEYNLEQDIQKCDWMLQKVRESDNYAQNLYAAMCNNVFQKNEVWPRLKDEHWSCTWRYAGGIIATVRAKGDYMDWYCSGIGNGLGNGDVDGTKGYVGESEVTDEIRQDLFAIGWTVEPYDEDIKF
jgi:hypothetical protein